MTSALRVWTAAVCLAGAGSAALLAQQDPSLGGAATGAGLSSLQDAMVRLPLACALGALLALRPKRRGTPTRTPAVIQTQIILAVVGAVIMLVVGSSLARAFGIVGAANLIRYRVKIDDPKDAGVMLCTLSLGLASGVGLYALAAFCAVFILVVLSVIESFEPTSKKKFELAVGAEKGADELRPRVEAVLDRFKLEYELRTSSPERIVYAVQVPLETDTEAVTDALLKLAPKSSPTVEWDQKRTKDK
jgi:uncharacterized membrane protein YhiD involved in acid resistance